jgi:hypothetical protein
MGVQELSTLPPPNPMMCLAELDFLSSSVCGMNLARAYSDSDFLIACSPVSPHARLDTREFMRRTGPFRCLSATPVGPRSPRGCVAVLSVGPRDSRNIRRTTHHDETSRAMARRCMAFFIPFCGHPFSGCSFVKLNTFQDVIGPRSLLQGISLRITMDNWLV